MHFKGVLFDMDGLLLDSERLVVETFQRTTEELALPDLTDVVLKMIGLRSDVGKRILQDALRGQTDHARFDARWHEIISDLFAAGIPLKPGVTQLLDHLAKLDLPCAVATSTKTANAEKHLQRAGIFEYFQTITGGDQVTNGKPAPDIYPRAAASIGLNPKNCAAFEDSDPGATAAHRSGATTVQVPDIKTPGSDMHNLGHVIAPTLMAGAAAIKLLPH